jgi:hypothetical protein
MSFFFLDTGHDQRRHPQRGSTNAAAPKSHEARRGRRSNPQQPKTAGRGSNQEQQQGRRKRRAKRAHATNHRNHAPTQALPANKGPVGKACCIKAKITYTSDNCFDQAGRHRVSPDSPACAAPLRWRRTLTEVRVSSPQHRHCI